MHGVTMKIEDGNYMLSRPKHSKIEVVVPKEEEDVLLKGTLIDEEKL